MGSPKSPIFALYISPLPILVQLEQPLPPYPLSLTTTSSFERIELGRGGKEGEELVTNPLIECDDSGAEERGRERERKGGRKRMRRLFMGYVQKRKRGGRRALYSTHVPYFVVRSPESYLSGIAETFLC